MTGAFQAKPARDPPHLCRSSESRRALRLPAACLWAPALCRAIPAARRVSGAVSARVCLCPACWKRPLTPPPASVGAPWVPSTCQALRQLTCSVVFTSCHRSQDSFEGESVSSVQESCVPLTEEGLVQVRWDHRFPEGTPSRPHPGATLQTRKREHTGCPCLAAGGRRGQGAPTGTPVTPAALAGLE